VGGVSGMDIGKLHPSPYRQMVKLDADVVAALETAQLEPLLVELVRIRVSQINGCAFCLRLHTREAIAKGESAERLAVLAAWWESQYFSAQERAALALAEQVTSLAVPERRTWDDGSLTEEQASAVAWLATVMNAWNRIAITSHHPVGP
jgi:AhpD family alkylhydroperoxidase